jgi:hypothetical protein
MLIAAAFSWWYGAGWVKQITLLQRQLLHAHDTFSVAELLRTLFAPFRQISAGGAGGPIGVRLRAWFDRLISRFVGAFVRLILILIGLAWIVIIAVFGVLKLALWPFLPLMPVVGILFFTMGASV